MGSEMCIRDSPFPLFRRLEWCAALDYPDSPPEDAEQSFSKWPTWPQRWRVGFTNVVARRLRRRGRRLDTHLDLFPLLCLGHHYLHDQVRVGFPAGLMLSFHHHSLLEFLWCQPLHHSFCDYCGGPGMKCLLGITIYLRCLLYTSPSPRDLSTSRMPSSA